MPAKASVLIVEDDAGARDLIRTRLYSMGYDAHTAHNGVEAMARLSTIQPHAIVLDINMPEMDGFSVLEALCKDRFGRGVPVLVLTARHAAEDVKRALRLGAKDYLAKPFNDNQLMARVARLMRPQLDMQRRLDATI